MQSEMFLLELSCFDQPHHKFSAGARIEEWLFNTVFTNDILFGEAAEDSSGYELPRTGCLADLKPLE